MIHCLWEKEFYRESTLPRNTIMATVDDVSRDTGIDDFITHGDRFEDKLNWHGILERSLVSTLSEISMRTYKGRWGSEVSQSNSEWACELPAIRQTDFFLPVMESRF
ncbi:hypothetical protein TNCV_2545611 [Trichonephila clavipes]|nr:hypothetical protein TNCV_2545611 [Trichonephila clavipes]